MRDIYLYEDCDVLKNLLNIRDKALLDKAEADYVTYRLKEIAINSFAKITIMLLFFRCNDIPFRITDSG